VTRSPPFAALENAALCTLREGVAEAPWPVVLFSAGKDSAVLADLALRAFYPPMPLPALHHVDSTWEFSELLAFRDSFASTGGSRREKEKTRAKERSGSVRGAKRQGYS
jgi:sulfate adenylyltransferase subunit 2